MELIAAAGITVLALIALLVQQSRAAGGGKERTRSAKELARNATEALSRYRRARGGHSARTRARMSKTSNDD